MNLQRSMTPATRSLSTLLMSIRLMADVLGKRHGTLNLRLVAHFHSLLSLSLVHSQMGKQIKGMYSTRYIYSSTVTRKKYNFKLNIQIFTLPLTGVFKPYNHFHINTGEFIH